MNVIAMMVLIGSIILGGCAHKKTDDLTKDKVVLIHGFARSNIALWKLDARLEEAGYIVERVGYSSLNQDMEGIKSEVYKKIDECCSNREGKVHFVGHSLGGLLVRSYLGERKLANLGNVVLMGSPNKGTAAVNFMQDKWWFKIAGPAAKSLGANGTKFLKSLKSPYYSLGVIAGYKANDDNEDVLPGKDDGLVTVESAKVDGMKDFIIIETSHTMMRYNKEVAKQVVHFLQDTKFKQ